MKREIKFRGKDILTDKWVYGDLLHLGDVCAIIRSSKNEKLKVNAITDQLEFEAQDIYGVIPETVGQFTGLLDGNGQGIFEGDIMRIPETEFNIEIIGVVEFDRGAYVVRSFFSGTLSSLAWAVRGRQSGERRGVVIGNIHDKPELLKGGAE